MLEKKFKCPDDQEKNCVWEGTIYDMYPNLEDDPMRSYHSCPTCGSTMLVFSVPFYYCENPY